jgi:PAS domain S-box-containing protein
MSDGESIPDIPSEDLSSLEELRRRERELSDFIENAAVGLHWVGADGTILWANQAELDLLGYAREEYIGRHIGEFHADEGTIKDILARLTRDETLHSYEASLRCKDGSVRHVLISSNVMRRGGEFIHTRCFTRDITDRKRAEEALRASEEQFRAVVETALDAVITIDEDSTILFVNQSTQKIFGYAPEELRGQHLTMLMPEYLRRLHQAGVHRYVETGHKHISWEAVELPGLHKDGHEIPLEISFSEFMRNGKRNFAGIARDITGRKRAEEERAQLLSSEQRARREAEAANRTKDEFLSTLSHELRTPLTAILGWSRMLKDGQLDEANRQRALETIERSARTQSQLIEDILDVSRVISGKMRLEVRPLNLETVIEAAVDTVLPAAEAKGIRLQRVLDSGASMVSGDPARLQQVVWNLVSNAIKFTPRGGRAQIRLERINSHVEIIVTDTGYGISPDVLPYVFDRFRQADSTITRMQGGLGLGLAIVRHLVELHGGTVEAESAGPGQGSTFTVKLPLIALRPTELRKTVEEDRVHPAQGASVPFHCPPELDGLHILVVDDEEDTRVLVATVLEKCAARVTSAGSAVEALALLKELRPDVLVSDLGMPEEDGYSLIRKVRALPAEEGGRTPAVALTAYARVEDRLKVLRSGFQTHLPKPVEPAELVAVVANVAGRSNNDIT